MAFVSNLKNQPDLTESSPVAISLKRKNGPENSSPDVSSFEKTYNTAYSHGLEKIYKLENVDLKSVRRIADYSQENSSSEDTVEFEQSIDLPLQLEFDLGDEFKSSIEHFVLREPINMLGLSRHAEKCLAERGLVLIKDLIEADLRQFVFIKGLGQGHIDDINRKLTNYIKGKALWDAKTIDFTSWLRTLVGDIDSKKGYVLLESFGLSGLFTLTPSENVEVKRLTLEKRQEWIQEVKILLLQESKVKQLHQDLANIINVFVKPWMKCRFGIATEAEIHERLLNLSDNPAEAKAVLEFFKEYYFNDKSPLTGSLKSLDEGLFAADKHIEKIYKVVIERAMTYFYKNDVRYPLNKLVQLLECEFASNWNGFPTNFVEYLLRISPNFRVRKDETGKLTAKLA